MKAKDIQSGDVLRDDTGADFKVIKASRTRAFRMSHPDYPEAFAIMVLWKGTHGDYTLYHPEDDVGEPIRRRKENTDG